MKKIYKNPVTETMVLNAETYLCQASSQHPSLSTSESTDSSETVF